MPDLFDEDTCKAVVGALAPAPAGEGAQAPAAAVLVGEHRRLFREEAVEAYLATLRESEVLRVAPPWTRAVMAMVVCLVVVGLAVSVVGKIEQTSRARGILRVRGGSQVLATQASGTILEVRAHSGDSVASGDVIASIDSAPIKAKIFEAERDIERAKTQLEAFEKRRDSIYAERRRLLERRIALLSARAKSQGASVARFKKRRVHYDRLQAEGAISTMDQMQSHEDLAAVSRENIRLHEEISETRLQLANLAQELDAELVRLQNELRAAQDNRDALAIALTQTTITAPATGRLEAVLVKPGDVMASGATVGRLVPEGAPLQIVAFLPERDRAFVEAGTRARVELDQLPATEFGMLDARVVRVSQELASNAEIEEALGDEPEVREPVFRVEMELADDVTSAKVAPYLRSGSLVVVRATLRERRIITVLLEPLLRWAR